MAVISTAPTFKAAFVAALLADTNLGVAGVQISYGFLTRDVEAETIAVGSIEWLTEEWAPFGTSHKKDERFAVSCWLFANKDGQTQQEATERAFTLLGYVETILRNNIRLNSANGTHWVQLDPRALVEGPGDDGYQAAAEFRVVVYARK